MQLQLRAALLGAALLLLLAPAAAREAPGDLERSAYSIAQQGLGSAPRPPPAPCPQAYASLLYGDEFLLGLRVLGQSLRETGTDRDLVALVTKDVSQTSVQTLIGDGWRVKRVDMVDNPGQWTQTATQKFPARFYGVYTKLLLWNLTEYERVVYLDADTIVVRNADELFLCDGLCGVLRHSERINTGVLVLSPSTALCEAMMASIANTPSYTGGDQGFINSFFEDFPEAPLFDPRKGKLLSKISEWRTSVDAARGMALGRLPTLYNADLGLYVGNSNRWTVAPGEIRVLHYTLAMFKPWAFWSGWIMGETAKQWQALRSRLPPSAEGLAGGQTAQQQTASFALLVLPMLTAALVVQRFCWGQGLGAFVRCQCSRMARALTQPVELGGPKGRTPHARFSNGGSSPVQSCSKAELQQLLGSGAAGSALFATVPAWLTGAAAVAGILSVLVSLAGAIVLIPHQIVPSIGWLLAYEVCSLCFVLLYSVFLAFCHRRGLRAVSPVALAEAAGLGSPGAVGAAGSGLARPWGATLTLFATILCSVGMVPWYADCLGIQSFVARVMLTFSAGIVTVILCTQCFISAALRWWSCGASEAAAAARVGSKLAA